MSEIISAVANHIQQSLQEQTLQQQPQPQSGEKRSFDSYLQQTPEAPGGANAGVEKPAAQTVSGSEMQSKLEQLSIQLERFNQNAPDKNKVNSMLPELLDNKSRLGLLKEAYSKIGDTSKATGNLSGQLAQTENEYKQVESIMKSDKSLSSGELLALQARLYQVSQHIEVMSKVVDQMAGGIKTVLNTNV